MKFYNFVSVDFTNIQFAKLQKKNELKYFKIKYNKTDFVIETPQFEYVGNIYNEIEKIYILKFIINDTSFLDFVKNLKSPLWQKLNY